MPEAGLRPRGRFDASQLGDVLQWLPVAHHGVVL